VYLHNDENNPNKKAQNQADNNQDTTDKHADVDSTIQTTRVHQRNRTRTTVPLGIRAMIGRFGLVDVMINAENGIELCHEEENTTKRNKKKTSTRIASPYHRRDFLDAHKTTELSFGPKGARSCTRVRLIQVYLFIEQSVPDKGGHRDNLEATHNTHTHTHTHNRRKHEYDRKGKE
jgi:hypothetical protein